ncbi:hypothetical protein VTO42DRAFT_4503 [Malbranchea cinnamomea]
MLSRAALPLLRQRTFQLPVRPSILALQTRRYTKNDRPPRPGVSKGSFPPRPSKSQSDPNQTSDSDSPTNDSTRKEFSEAQTEFESNAEYSQNTESRSAGAGAGVNHARKAKPDAETEFSENQTEFDTAGEQKNGQPEAESQTPKRPLPDLTKGIPSTLAAEVEARSKSRGSTYLNLTEDPDRAYNGSAGGEGGEDIPRSDYVSSLEERRNRLTNIGYAIMFTTALGAAMYLGRNWDSEEEEKAHPDAPSGWGFGLFYKRIKARASDITGYYTEPAFQKLLPDEDPQYRQPYTLVLSLEDLLVHDTWDREHGWRTAKRPGVDYFLRYLNQYYELVLFTSVPSMIADQTLRALDPYRIIRWPLFREATKYEDGEYVKDLSYLNRDLSKVILIDTHKPHAKRQPENAIILPKWKGDKDDKTLVALIPFLEYIAGMGIEDVRPVLKSFEGTYIPAEFARREKAMREKFEKQLAEERAKKSKRNIGGLASLFGIKPQPTFEGIEHSYSDEPKMLWDQIRERGQKQYQMIEKEIQENGQKWLAEMAAEEEKARQEQMKGMKSGFASFFGLSSGENK